MTSFSLFGLQSFPSRVIAVSLGFCQRLCQRICRHLFSLEVLNGYDLISYEIFKVSELLATWTLAAKYVTGNSISGLVSRAIYIKPMVMLSIFFLSSSSRGVLSPVSSNKLLPAGVPAGAAV
eukprot:gene8584-9457_t